MSKVLKKKKVHIYPRDNVKATKKSRTNRKYVLEPCPCVLQGMRILAFRFWEETAKLQDTLPALGAEQQLVCIIPL